MIPTAASRAKFLTIGYETPYTSRCTSFVANSVIISANNLMYCNILHAFRDKCFHMKASLTDVRKCNLMSNAMGAEGVIEETKSLIKWNWLIICSYSVISTTFYAPACLARIFELTALMSSLLATARLWLPRRLFAYL